MSKTIEKIRSQEEPKKTIALKAGILVQTRRRPQTICQNLFGAKSSMHFWNLKVLDTSQQSTLLFLCEPDLD